MIAIFLAACGGGGEGNDIGSQQEQSISMVPYQKYILNKGDIIKREAENTIVQLDANLEENTTTATLMKGEAKLIFN